MAGSADLNEINRAIGRLESGIDESLRHRTEIVEKLDKLIEVMPLVADIRMDLDELCEEVRPVIEAHKSNGVRNAGIATGVGLGAGLSGAGLLPWIKALIVGAAK